MKGVINMAKYVTRTIVSRVIEATCVSKTSHEVFQAEVTIAAKKYRNESEKKRAIEAAIKAVYDTEEFLLVDYTEGEDIKETVGMLTEDFMAHAVPVKSTDNTEDDEEGDEE